MTAFYDALVAVGVREPVAALIDRQLGGGVAPQLAELRDAFMGLGMDVDAATMLATTLQTLGTGGGGSAPTIASLSALLNAGSIADRATFRDSGRISTFAGIVADTAALIAITNPLRVGDVVQVGSGASAADYRLLALPADLLSNWRNLGAAAGPGGAANVQSGPLAPSATAAPNSDAVIAALAVFAGQLTAINAAIAALQATQPEQYTFGSQKLIGGNFWFLTDYDKSYPWSDMVVTSRGFKPLGDWGGATAPDVPLKANGWPAGDFSHLILVNGCARDAGVYSLSWTGQASVALPFGNGALSAITYSAGTNKSTCTITAGANINDIAMNFTGVSADFADLKIMAPGYANSSAVWRSEFLEHITPASTLRFMDWLLTNNNTDTDFATGSAGAFAHKTRYKHSVDAGVDLCNAAGANWWGNIPAMYTDAAIGAFVNRVVSRLSPTLTGYFEFTNEPWNDQFAQTSQLIAATKTEADIRTRAQILSVTRTSGVVTVVLATTHLKTGNFDVAVACGGITAQGPSAERFTATVTSPNSFTFPQPGADASGVIDTGSDNTAVFLNPNHRLAKPLATFGLPTAGIDVYGAKRRYEVDRCWVIHQALVAAGATARFKVVVGNQLGTGTEYSQLAYAKEQYGSADWLMVAPAYYMLPTNAESDAFTTPAQVLANLDSKRAEMQRQAWVHANNVSAFGVGMVAYEGGPHTNWAQTPVSASAIADAHRSDGMRLLIKQSIQDWRNVGGGLFNYYVFGSRATWGAQTPSGDTWPLVEGGLGAGVTSPKREALVEMLAVSSVPVPIPGKTSGTISIPEAFTSGSGGNAPSNGNKLFPSNFAMSDIAVQVCRTAAGPATLSVRAGSQAASDWITILVNGAVVANQVAFAGGENPFLAAMGEAWVGNVTLNQGINIVTLRVKPTARGGFVGLHSIVVS